MTTPEISITRAGGEPGAATLTVSVPVSHVEAAELKAAETIARRAKLRGFRAGKAPLGVVRRQYRETIRDTVLRDLIRETWETAVEREQLKPIGEPHIHNLKFEAGVPLTFEIHVEVKPELNLTRLGGFRLTRRVRPVTAEMVEAQLQEVRARRAPWVPLEGEPPKPGDLVHVSIGVIGGESSEEARAFQLVLGEGRALPAVEDQIMALRPGETVEADIRYPDDHQDQSKRGTSRRVRIVLHEAKRQQLPELTDDFAREVGDFETLDALRQAVQQDLVREAEREADGQARGQLIEQLAQANAVTAPRPLVERVLVGLAQAAGIAEDQWERFSTELRPVAEAQVRRDLILDWVADAHGLRASEGELDERVRKLAERRGTPPGELYARLQKERRLRDLEHGITEEKVYAHLLSLSTITEG